MTDLTGWTPHDGYHVPHLPEGSSGDLIVLLHGGAEGTKESGPAHAASFNWVYDPGSFKLPDDYQPDPMDVLMGRASLGPDGQIIAWVPVEKAGGRMVYPHVRADLLKESRLASKRESPVRPPSKVVDNDQPEGGGM